MICLKIRKTALWFIPTVRFFSFLLYILVTGDGERLGHSSPGEFFVQTNLKTDVCCKQKEPMSAHQFF